MVRNFDVIIVGSGHGGAQAAIALRQHKFDGSIAIVSDDCDPPYERPPLSKEYLAGGKTFERILIRPAHFWESHQVALRLGQRVVGIDPDAHEAILEDGERLAYGSLVWAAGAYPRRLSCPGGDLPSLHTVRTRADVDRMTALLPAVERIAVIGGGYIGLEAAAVLTKLGKKVILLEAMDRVLSRVAGEPISRFYESEHRQRGVDVQTGGTVRALDRRGVELAGRSRVNADMIIVGIGIQPAVEPLLAAGAAGNNGVDVDSLCQTSLPNVYAVGDCAAHESRFADGARIRLESVQNASDQAVVVAKAIAGAAEPYSTVPWFWSNQFDLKLQTVGISLGYDDLVVRGDPSTRSFSVVYLKRGRVIALDCVNAVRDYVQGRKLVAQGASLPTSSLADAGVSLKELLG